MNEEQQDVHEVRVRFAPSPTGYLHVGGARTALFNYLFARKTGGRFLLRIEDTDRTRYQPEALEEIFASLRWLGLDWDEGPEKGGEYGPYVQSERTERYREHAELLLQRGMAYRCFCTSERLDRVRQEREANRDPQAIGYDRHCRDLGEADVQRKLDAGEPYVVRLKVPLEGEVVFQDQVRGEIRTRCDLLDDLVLLKSDGFPTYHLANVVDDHAMRISHVMRGDEWIATTPRHVILYQALGWEPPVFAHLPVILSAQGGKLSKRKGAASVLDYQRAGFLPEALVNFLALLGWNPGDERELMTLDELCASFSLERVTPKASVFDEKKLEWMNGHYLAQADSKQVLQYLRPLWTEQGLDHGRRPEAFLVGVVDLLKSRSRRVGEIVESSAYFFQEPQTYEEKAVRKRFTPDGRTMLDKVADALDRSSDFSAAVLEHLFAALAEKDGVGAGQVIHPTRLALTGVSVGPGLFELMELLGRETCLERIRKACLWIDEKRMCDTKAEA